MDLVKNNEEWKSLKIYLMSLEKNPAGGGVSSGGGGGAEDGEVGNGGGATGGTKKGGKGTKRKQQANKERPNKSQRINAPED